MNTAQIVWVSVVLLMLPMHRSVADSLIVPEVNENLSPAWLLELPQSVEDILIADTSSATMYRFRNSPAGLIEIDQRYMSIGLKGVRKERAWDRRTPLGVYFITESLDTTRLADKYGVGAYPLDYPNAWDRFNSRTGDGIWLHGVDHKNPDRPPLDTDGCLALPNEEILKLVSNLKPLVTPVIVAREMRWARPGETETVRSELKEAVERWRASQESNDLLAYLDLYAEDFRYRDMDRSRWAAFRLGVFEARPLAALSLENLMLVADPEASDLYLSRFKQTLTTESGPVTSTKRLYWRRSGAGDWKIVAEDAG